MTVNNEKRRELIPKRFHTRFEDDEVKKSHSSLAVKFVVVAFCTFLLNNTWRRMEYEKKRQEDETRIRELYCPASIDHLRTDTAVSEDEMFLYDDCDTFLNTRGYLDLTAVTEEELSFPLAFGILVYKSFSQFERMLRLVYRPHNVYCVHVDKSSPVKFRKAVRRLAACLPNVSLCSVMYDVRWGSFNVTLATVQTVQIVR